MHTTERMLKVSHEAVERCVVMKDPVARNKKPFFFPDFPGDELLQRPDFFLEDVKDSELYLEGSMRGCDIYRLASQMFTCETSCYFSTGTTARSEISFPFFFFFHQNKSSGGWRNF